MWMKNVKPPSRPAPVEGEAVVEATFSEADATRLMAILGGGPPQQYDSDDMEADFSTAVQLLMDALPYLWVLRDMNKHQDFMQAQTEEDFKDTLEAIEEFTGQW